jgi:deoxyribodipyrimidine photo-lyase
MTPHSRSHHTGADVVPSSWRTTSPYVRVFNPVTQSKRFDPNGDYIRRHVEELRGLPAPQIHQPWTLPGGPPNNYPFPIVDHAVERSEALRRYNDSTDRRRCCPRD